MCAPWVNAARPFKGHGIGGITDVQALFSDICLEILAKCGSINST
jgi:hypothetical protein